MSTRNLTVDIAKGIGIYLVILGHLTHAGEIQRTLIHSFHMPLFMLLSGFFFYSKPPLELTRKFSKKFLLISYATLVIDIMLSLCYTITKGTSFPDLLEWVKTLLLYGGMWKNAPIWFLFSLLLCQLICTLCLRKSRRLLACVMVVLIVFDITLVKIIPVVWWPFSVLFAFPFFAIGYFGKEHVAALKKLDKLWIILPMSVVFIGLTLFNGYTDMYSLLGGKSYLLFLATGVTGSILLLKLASLFNGKAFGKTLAYLGKNTIPILITHYYICRIAVPVFMAALNLQSVESNIFFQIFVSVLITAVYAAVLKFPFSKWLRRSPEKASV